MIDPIVTIVIPTYNRPEFLKRAITSVLNQNFDSYEIVVVVDGQSDATEKMIEQIRTTTIESIRLVQTIEKVGGSQSRNIGVQEAKGKYIAFLDDDDEWFDNKLREQINLIDQYNFTDSAPFLCFTSLLRYKDAENKQYSQLPNVNYEESKEERLADYLFKTSHLRNIGFIQTSTVIVPKWLALQSPFTKGLPKHQDWDWLLKLDREHDLKVIQVEEPQIIYHSDVPKNSRIGYINRWPFTEQWGNDHRNDFSKQGYESFLLNYVMLGIAEDQRLTLIERIKKIGSRWYRLSLRTKIRPYTWKMIVYFSAAIKNNKVQRTT